MAEYNYESELGNFEIPSLPQIYFQIREAIDDPESSIERIGSIISKDVGLASSLLRIANSAAFGAAQSIDTVTRALVRIGTEEVHAIVLGATITKLFKGIPEDLVNMRQFWKHSIACGIMARCIATYIKMAHIERYFLAGMLHDLGKLVLFHNKRELSKRILLDSIAHEKLHHIAERDTLGFDHTHVSKILLEKWNIPESIGNLIVFHHSPEESALRLEESSILHISDVIINGLRIGSSASYFVPDLFPTAWDSSGLEPAMIPVIVKHAEIQIKGAVDSILSST